MKVEIDRNSGFCGGVIRAIRSAETFLNENGKGSLFSLGAIVHNDAELERLERLGLTTIDYDDLGQGIEAEGHTLLIRAHGEPPLTYLRAEAAGFKIIDCTCPVVLDLQKSIRDAYARALEEGLGRQIIIFGQPGHAEVLGLMGQISGAIVIQDTAMLENAFSTGLIDRTRPAEIFSQTTKNPVEYAELCKLLKSSMEAEVTIHNTICTQVAMRQSRLSEFAARHDVIVFVSGKSSSNGKVLCSVCKKANIRTYHIESCSELRREWFRPTDNAGICGATSTPGWLLEEVASKILEIGDNFTTFAAQNTPKESLNR